MKCSIRDLLFVMEIVAVLAAWWVEHRRLRDEVEKSELEKPPLARGLARERLGAHPHSAQKVMNRRQIRLP